MYFYLQCTYRPLDIKKTIHMCSYDLYWRNVNVGSGNEPISQPILANHWHINLWVFDSVASQRTHGVIITSWLRQNDVATSFWRYHGVIIASYVRYYGDATGRPWFWSSLVQVVGCRHLNQCRFFLIVPLQINKLQWGLKEKYTNFISMKNYLKMLSAKWHPSCSGITALTTYPLTPHICLFST